MDLEFIEENKINKIFEKWEKKNTEKFRWTKKFIEKMRRIRHTSTHTHSMIKFKQNKIL